MDSLENLLKTNKPQEPPQLKALREYVKYHHQAESKSSVSSTGYSLTVESPTLASTLQLEKPNIQDECQLDKKLFIRIGYLG